tara:strand:- start:115 stop:906 length:792 start_codon:yes stop_codon:yes gene_type:complete
MPQAKREGGIASLIRGAKRLASTVVGRRSETGYVPGVSEAIYNTVIPDYEGAHYGQFADALRRIARGDPGDIDSRMGPMRTNREGELMKPRGKGEEDAWRMYLGLPQASGTLQESEYRPTIGSGEDIRYRDFSRPDRVIDTLASYRPRRDLDEPLAGFDPEAPFTSLSKRARRRAYVIEGLVKEIEERGGSVLETDTLGFGGDVMGDYTLGVGEDEGGSYLSYYDKWDLAPQVAQISRAGQPFDIYGRMYYDPETYEYLDPAQ